MIRSRLAARGAVLSLCLAVVACTELPPRTFTEFMEDAAAREGTLVRCNADRRATIDDIECANARRAAAAVALEVERARRAELEAESDRLRSELHDRIARQQAAEREAEELRRAMQQAAYDAQWGSPEATETTSDAEPPPQVANAPDSDPAQ
jgi:chromosome segregation ATPase